MVYREKSSFDLHEKHLRDIVLRQHSAFGPWLVMGLGLVLAFFLSYLVYANLFLASAVTPSPERSLRTITDSWTATAVSLPGQVRSLPVASWEATATRVPQSRATNTLVGGEGPALLRSVPQ